MELVHLTPFISEPIKAGHICLKTQTGNSWDSIGKHPIKIRLKLKILIVGCSYLGNDKIPSPHILNRVILIVYLHYNTVCTKQLLMASMFIDDLPLRSRPELLSLLPLAFQFKTVIHSLNFWTHLWMCPLSG